MRLKDWAIFFRVPNLFIVALTLIVLHFKIKAWSSNELVLSLDSLLFLILSTLLVTLGGYIINDYFDKELDLVNKPTKTFIGSKIIPQRALVIYALTILIAIFCAYLFSSENSFSFFQFLVPICILALWLYAAYLKKSFLIGNLLVAVLSALVPILLFLALSKESYTNSLDTVSTLIFAYAAFAFWSTLIREVIKDKEDELGDRESGAKTFALAMSSKMLSRILLFMLIPIAPAVILFYSNYLDGILLIFASLFVLIPYAMLFRILKTKNSVNWGQASLWMKLLMLGGLIMLFFL